MKNELEQLKNKIYQIGQEMVNCSLNCNGIENKKKIGAIPRGLYLETEKRTKEKGIIVVGMNPGKIDNDPQEYKDILKEKCSYQNYIESFKKNILHKSPYFERTREILDILNFTGPILWTEIVKCQSEENGKLDFPTIRNCAHKFLKNEVALVDYPILALGDKAYPTCLLIFPERKIIGSPHPSGANPRFHRFLKNLKGKQLKIKQKIGSLEGNESIHLKELIEC